MTAEEYLTRPYKLKKAIDYRQDEINELNALARSTSASVGGMPHSSSPDLQLMETIIAKVMDLEKENKRCIQQLAALKADAIDVFMKVTNKTQRTILIERYLKFKSWAQIAETMILDKRWVQRQHARSLKKVAEILKLTDR